MTDLNPQIKEMSDESMVRNLAAQAEVIWPQERALLERYALHGAVRILDAGCGTGEASWRLAEHFPESSVLGVDILDHHLERARRQHARFAPRVTFEHRSIFDLGLPEASFDLVVCRHVLQSVPHAERVLAEFRRVTRAGGWLHLIVEDYDMIHFQRGTPDPREFWHEVAARYTDVGGSNLFIGRECAPLLQAQGFEEVRVDYLVIDSLRVPRETFARIFEAWRDGYAEPIARLTRFSESEARACFDAMVAGIRDPGGYAVWLLPVVSARVPA